MKGFGLVREMMYKTSRSLKHNTPVILSCVGAVGVVATAVLASKASIAAKEILDEIESESEDELTIIDKVKEVGHLYIPTVATGVATISCVLLASTLNKKQQASMAGALVMLDRSFRQYKTAAKELFGDDVDFKINEHLVSKDSEFIENEDIPEGKLLFYEPYGCTYFEKSMLEVQNAYYHFNRNFTLRGYAYLNELYAFLELPETELGNNIGWSLEIGVDYGYSWVDFYHKVTDLDDGLQCYIIEMPFEPLPIF